MANTDTDDDGFLARWSRRKADARSGGVAGERPPSAPARPAEPGAAASPAGQREPPGQAATLVAAASPGPQRRTVPGAGDVDRDPPPPSPPPAPAADPPPTLDDVARLTPASDFSRFVRADVDPSVRNAALKKLFAAPEFNVMDGLDVYIDDYSRPAPLPPAMLRRLARAADWGLTQPAATAPTIQADAQSRAELKVARADTAPALPAAEASPDEDPAVRLQPDDAAGPAGAAADAGGNAGRQR